MPENTGRFLGQLTVAALAFGALVFLILAALALIIGIGSLITAGVGAIVVVAVIYGLVLLIVRRHARD